MTKSRRDFLKAGAAAVAATGFGGTIIEARAQGRDKAVMVISSATFEPGTCTLNSIPMEMGYWAQEGLEVDIKSARGSALGAQMVMTGQADLVHTGTSVGLMVPISKGAPLVAVYNMITQNFQMPAVPADGPIRTLADLKGRKLGVIGQGTATIPIVKAVLEDAGLDPNKDVTFVDVGYGAQAAAALWLTKQVDGLAMYDSVYAAIENVNPDRYKLRILKSPLSDRISFQTALVCTRPTLKAKREILVKLIRGMAKASVFALENPEAAARIHFKRYPEQRPTGVNEATALAQGRRAVVARLTNMRIDNMAVPRDKWGTTTKVDADTYVNILKKIGEVDKALDPASLYTNELVDDINRFDVAAVRKAAREYKG